MGLAVSASNCLGFASHRLPSLMLPGFARAVMLDIAMLWVWAVAA
jgi:hypothetical protein